MLVTAHHLSTYRNMKLFAFLLLFFIAKADDKVKVSVYYETLCPDSVDFVNNQLYPNYKLFGKYLIDLELVPYGFAKEIDRNGSVSFSCQHGVDECYGNKVHGCVIDSQSITKSVEFIYCSESSSPPTSQENLQSCAEKSSISWSGIEECLSDGLANDIMSQNGKKTAKLDPSWIPSIVFNDKYNDKDQNEAVVDLKKVLCKYLDDKPSQCSSVNEIKVFIV